MATKEDVKMNTKNTIDEQLPSDFDVKIYKELHSDLKKLTDLQAKKHYAVFGMNEGRKYKKSQHHFDINDDYVEYFKHIIDDPIVYINNYDNVLNYDICNMDLFFKFPKNIDMTYEIKQQCTPYKQNICHFHIYDLNDLHKYSHVINIVALYCSVIITCIICPDTITIEHTIIKMNNVGYDIGGKLIFYDYLLKNNIKCDNILFMHGKSNIDRFNIYTHPIAGSSERLLLNLNILNNTDIGAIFPDCIHNNWTQCFSSYDVMLYNATYHKNMLELFKIKKIRNDIFIFPEGNVFLMKYNIFDKLFSDKYNTLYKLLNNEDSFDVNWFKHKYSLHNLSNDELFDRYINNKDKYAPNNLKVHYTAESFPDAMVEHSFERILFDILFFNKTKFLVVDKQNIFKKYGKLFNVQMKDNVELWEGCPTGSLLLLPKSSTIDVNIFVLCYNEKILLPLMIQHYKKYIPNCKITILDNMSIDGSDILAKELGCNVIRYDTNGITNDFKMAELKNNCWKHITAGWIIVIDMDEWLCVSQDDLKNEQNEGTTILKVKGMNMIGESKTTDLLDINLHAICKYVDNEYENKNLCFFRNKIDEINYECGAHVCAPIGVIKFSTKTYINKHMDVLGEQYKINKSTNRYAMTHEMRKVGMCGHYTDNIDNIKKLYAASLEHAKILESEKPFI